MSRKEFIERVAPITVKVRVDGGVLFPSVSIAQTILETGGKIHPWNNIVGYKVGSGRRTPYWHGKSVNKRTWEVYDGVRHDNVSADFRAYDTIEDCLKDQALLFLNNRNRYQRVIDAKTPQEQAKMLQACGYATDPQYADKITSIMRTYKLDIYDKEAEKAMERLAEFEKALKNVANRLALLEAAHTSSVPDWAKEAVNAAVNKRGKDGKPIVDTPDGGSIDFYRFITILDRLGLFDKEDGK